MSRIFVNGRIDLGELPDSVQARLAALPGVWLEYEPKMRAVVVRHVQPAKGPILATTVSELVRILDELPADRHPRIPGGDLFVHTEDSDHLVRLRVTEGGALHIQWAHPAYDGAARRPYTDGREIAIESWEQRLNGSIELAADSADEAAGALQELADTFEGLYPEGEFRAQAAGDGTVRVDISNVNLDAALLIEALRKAAQPRSLSGWLEVTSFEEGDPEHHLRCLFKKGEIWVQHPILWSDPPSR